MLSGIVEITLGLSFVVLYKKALISWITAVFFVFIFLGNISQYVHEADTFKLDSDTARLVRLIFQSVLIIWALWSTGTWKVFNNRNK